MTIHVDTKTVDLCLCGGESTERGGCVFSGQFGFRLRCFEISLHPIDGGIGFGADILSLLLRLVDAGLSILTDLLGVLLDSDDLGFGIVDAVMNAGNIRFHPIDAFIGFHFDVVDTGIGISHALIRFIGRFLSIIGLAPSGICHPLVIIDGIDDEIGLVVRVLDNGLHFTEGDLGDLDVFPEFIHRVDRGDNLRVEIAQERRLLPGQGVICHTKGCCRLRGIDEIEIDGGHHHEFIDPMGL